ncbi:MAG: phage tail protein [Nitratireductor sp.]
MTATYPEPGEAWATKDAPERTDTAFIAADGGRKLSTSISFPAVHSGTQVQRLMTTALKEARRFRTHSLSLPPQAWLLEPGDVISWTSARNGYSAKKFIIEEMSGRRTFIQQVALKEIDPGDQDWTPASDEIAFTVVPVSPARPAAQVMTGWSVASATIGDASGAARRPAIEVSFAGALNDIRSVQVQIRVKATAAVISTGKQPMIRLLPRPRPSSARMWWVARNTRRAGASFPSARDTEWSSWLDVTAPEIGFSLADFTSSVTTTLAQMRVDLDNALDNITLGFTETQISLVGAETYRRTLKASTDTLSATVVSEQQARVDGDTALASSLDAVSASIGDGTASGLVKLEATAAPSGVSVRFGTYLRASVEDAYLAEAAEYLEITTGGIARKVTVADQWAIVDPTTGDLIGGWLDGELYSPFANLGTVTAGLIQSADASIELDLDNNEFRVDGTPFFYVDGGQTYLDVDFIKSGSLSSAETATDSTTQSGSSLNVTRSTLTAFPAGAHLAMLVFRGLGFASNISPSAPWSGTLTWKIERKIGSGAWTVIYSQAVSGGQTNAGSVSLNHATTYIDLVETSEALQYRINVVGTASGVPGTGVAVTLTELTAMRFAR